MYGGYLRLRSAQPRRRAKVPDFAAAAGKATAEGWEEGRTGSRPVKEGRKASEGRKKGQ